LFAPSTDALKTVESTQKKVEQSLSTLKAWTEARSTITQLRLDDGTPLGTRSEILREGGDEAAKEPGIGDDAEDRKGLSGVQSMINEAKALAKVAKATEELEKLSRVIDTLPHHTDPLLAATLDRERVRATIELKAIQELLKRAVDARLVADDITTRTAGLQARVDRLTWDPQAGSSVSDQPRAARPPGAALERGRVAPTDLLGLDLPAPVIVALQGVARAVASGGRLVGELVVVVLTLAGVVLVGLVAIYFGKSWGTQQDFWIAALGAATGTLALAPLLTALDRISGAKADAKAAAKES
jgi:hypothetical protein